MEFIAESRLPTRFGEFSIYAFKEDKYEHVAIANGEIKDDILVRIHSKCLTGDTLASLRCDCRDQLEKAMRIIGKKGGMLIYLDQEGRGIGLTNKIKAYALQDKGMDTVEANKMLGFHDDERNYEVAAEILKYFKLKQIRLLTNNPRKMKGIENKGIKVERVSIKTEKNVHNIRYLETKRKKLEHMV